MALNYLLSPEFQIVNTAGKPATGGYLEVYISGSRERYYCASDFNGTLYPFQVPLDSLGSNVVLADDSHAYDVYAYNRYGSLLMSRYNVHPSSGGGMGGVITSTDGSVTVTPTQDGYDLSVNDNKAAALKAAADTLYEDGSYYFRFMEGEGDQITVQNGTIILQDGWYHFSATVKLNWTGVNVNQTDQLKLYTELTYDIIDFDYSYNHADTVMLDGDIHIAPHSTQYISFGRTFTLAILGMHTGLSAELVDLDIHSITGQGFAGSYVPGEGIIIDSTNEISVDTTVIQEKLEAGDNIVIEGNVISATAEPQQQADWTESDTTSVTYIQNKPQNLVQDPDYVHTDNNFTDAEQSKLAGIEAGAEANVQSDWTETDSSDDAYIKHKPGTKPVAAGDNITITETASQFVISAADQQQANWNESDTDSAQYIQNKPDLSVYATTQAMDTALAGKQDVISDLATIRSGAALGATSVQPADLAPYATTADMNTALAGKQDVLTAGNNITITNNVISADAAPQLQANWTEADNTSVQYIQNKPSEKSLVAGTHVTLTESGSVVSVNADWPTVDQTYDATSTNAQSGVAVASAIANNGLFEAVYGTTTLAAVQNAISAHKIVYCRVSGRMAFLAFIGTSNVEFQYYRSNSQGTGDSVFVYTVSSSGWTTTERPAYVQANWNTSSSSAASYIKNKPSIPTKTSDLTNDSGFITASDVPAQVQSDWTEADTTSASYIANKPNLALKEDVSNKAQSVIASSTTDYPSSAATAQFVNSSIATATARFLGNYTLTDLGLTYPATDSQIETALDGYTFQSAPTNNDYVYVEIQNPQTTSVDDMVKRFKFNGTNWLYEYTLNNSSFTAAEIAAIDSGVNATKVGNYDSHIADTTIHVTAADKTAWNGKQDAISDLATIRSGAALGATSVQPSDLATVATTGDYSDLLNAPTLAAVATSGDYTDLSNTPHIPVIGTVTL